MYPQSHFQATSSIPKFLLEVFLFLFSFYELIIAVFVIAMFSTAKDIWDALPLAAITLTRVSGIVNIYYVLLNTEAAYKHKVQNLVIQGLNTLLTVPWAIYLYIQFKKYRDFDVVFTFLVEACGFLICNFWCYFYILEEPTFSPIYTKIPQGFFRGPAAMPELTQVSAMPEAQTPKEFVYVPYVAGINY